MGMGILWSVTKPLLTQGYPQASHLIFPCCFLICKVGDSRHSHLLGLWVAETVMLNMPVSSVPVTTLQKRLVEPVFPCKHLSLPKDCPGCVSTGCTGQKDPSVADSTSPGAVHTLPSWELKGRVRHP